METESTIHSEPVKAQHHDPDFGFDGKKSMIENVFPYRIHFEWHSHQPQL